MIVIVTGTPGTGKTTFAKKYAEEHGYEYIDGNKVIDDNNLIESEDKEKDSLVVDEEKFAKACEKIIASSEKNLIIDSHMSHFIDSSKVDLCFVTHCDLKVLRERLEERGYKEQKIRDNLEAEIFRECQLEAEELGHKMDEINTTS